MRLLAPVEATAAFAALREMAEHVTRVSDVAEARLGQLSVVHALLRPKACYVAEFVPAKGRLQIAQVRGRNDERIAVSAPGVGVVGRAFQDRTVVSAEGITAVPLMSGEDCLGCLVVVTPRCEAPRELLLALASHVCAAWEHARLKDDSARRNKDLQTAVAGLKAIEKNREELLSSVSHDLKNPLTTIKTYLSLLTRGRLGAPTEEQLKAIQTCDRNADRLIRMVNDLLLMSRLQSGRMQLNERPFGLKALAEEVVKGVSPLSGPAGVEVKVRASPEVFVKGDRERMSQALFNLVELGVMISPPRTAVELRIGEEAGLAVVSVRQEVVIGEADLERLFEPYYRPESIDPKLYHAGLELPIVSRIVHLHGGKVEAAPLPEGGTAFHVFLPMFAGAVAPAQVSQAPRPGGILIVEDDDDCREVVQHVLEQEGYRVMAARSSAEAVSILANIRPAMVLLDLRLRNEDGRAVLQTIRRAEGLRDLPVYLMSGSSEIGSVAAGQGEDRVDGFFEKPIQVAKLLDTVAAVVRPSRRAV